MTAVGYKPQRCGSRPHPLRAARCLALLALCLAVAGTSAGQEKFVIDPDGPSMIVLPDYLNELQAGSAGIPGALPLGGHRGAYALPNSLDTPVVPEGGGIRFTDSVFGTPVASFPVSPRAVADEAIALARDLLYVGSPGVTQDGDAAFQYLDLLFGPGDGGVPISELESQSGSEFIDRMFTPEHRLRADEAQQLLRDALAISPHDRDLRRELLDAIYNQVRVELILARDGLADANFLRLDYDADLIERTIDQEINAYAVVLTQLQNAATPYFDLLQDRMGLSVQWHVDGRVMDGSPFGFYLFREETPGRSLYAGTYSDPAKQLVDIPVLDENGDGEPDRLLSGYKDLVLLFDVLRDHADTARELVRLYIMRNDDSFGDLDLARAMIGEHLDWSYVHGNFLANVFPELTLNAKSLNGVTGLPEQFQSWRHALSELDAMNGTLDGENNLLGFRDDFLMLVQASGEFFDSYDALALWNEPSPENPFAPSSVALAKLDEARNAKADYEGAYGEVQGSHGALAAQHIAQIEGYDDRLLAIVGALPGTAGYDAALEFDLAYDSDGDPDTPETQIDPALIAGSELALQMQSLLAARLQIKKNDEENANKGAEMDDENERRAIEAGVSVESARLYRDTGYTIAGHDLEIGFLNAGQAFANELAAAADGVSVTFGTGGVQGTVSLGAAAHLLNAFVQFGFEAGKGALEQAKTQAAYSLESNLIGEEDMLLSEDSRIRLEALARERTILGIETQEAQLMAAQELDLVAALFREVDRVETLIGEADGTLVPRLFADPVHRLRFQSRTIQADRAFRMAQKWVFFTVRAFEYKWNTAFEHTYLGRTFSIRDVYRARNAEDLTAIQAALHEDNMEREGFSATDDRFDWFSFREDFLGFTEGGTFVDPVTGESVDALTAFRSYLKDHTDDSGILSLDFDTVRSDGTFFTAAIFDDTGAVATPGLWNDKIVWLTISIPGNHPPDVADTVLGALTYGGTSFVRTQFLEAVTDPANRPNELTAWATRYWFKAPDETWRFQESQTATVSINVVDNPLQPETVNQINVFRERSVAATEWTLKIFLVEGETQKIDIDDINDIELYFYHQAKDRLTLKKSDTN